MSGRLHPSAVLVVEDDPGARRLVTTILEGRGHEVDAYADGASGWASWQKNRHHLVIVDWEVPGLSGLEVCRKIREVPDVDDTFILFITGREDRASLEAALEAGASDYLGKSSFREQIDIRLAIAERYVRRAEARRRREEDLARDAHHDPLTGLPNRSLFLERLERAARRSNRGSGYIFAVLTVDLDDFREVNESHGRPVGDQVLRDAGDRLLECIRSVDTAARIGSDNFAVLLDEVNDVSDPTRVSHRIHQALSLPFRVGSHEVRISGCVGIALSITGFESPPDLLRDAETALLRAKAEGKGTHQMFDPVIQARAVARIELEGQIRRAVEEQEMVIHYQPVVDLRNGTTRAVEALVRWQTPDRGLVLPDEFVPVAEDTGLIVPLGAWVLREALGQLGRWRKRFGDETPSMSVNISSKQVSRSSAAEEIVAILEELELPGASVHLEITETSLMRNPEVAGRLLRRFRDVSVRLHVDDFGTGYSSLAYLCRFPIDALKIDRSFVAQMDHSRENLEVVRTIVRLARNLGMDVIAEGVETEGQLRLLREMEVDFVQGFLFSRAVPAPEVEELFAPGMWS